MRQTLLLSILLFSLIFSEIVLATGSRAPAPQDAAGSAIAGASGRWVINIDFYGTTLFLQMELKEEAGKLTGNLGGDKLEGTVTNNSLHFVAKDEQGRTAECTATMKDGTMSGTIVLTDAGDPAHPSAHSFTATSLPPQRQGGSPQRHEFTPTTFYREFSAANKPVLTVSPKDTVPPHGHLRCQFAASCVVALR